MPEPFRAYGSRSSALAQVEWRLELPAPGVGLGSFASTGRRMTLAPFLAAGWAERPLDGLPWSGSDGVRPVAGVALEWFMRLLRVEAGVGLGTGGSGSRLISTGIGGACCRPCSLLVRWVGIVRP